MSSSATVCDNCRKQRHCVARRRPSSRRGAAASGESGRASLTLTLGGSALASADLLHLTGPATLLVRYELLGGGGQVDEPNESELLVVCNQRGHCCAPTSQVPLAGTSASVGPEARLNENPIKFKLLTSTRPTDGAGHNDEPQTSCNLEVNVQMLTDEPEKQFGFDLLIWPAARATPARPNQGRLEGLELAARLTSAGRPEASDVASKSMPPDASVIKITANQLASRQSVRKDSSPSAKQATLRLQRISLERDQHVADGEFARLSNSNRLSANSWHLSASGGFPDWPLRRSVAEMAGALCLSHLHATALLGHFKSSDSRQNNSEQTLSGTHERHLISGQVAKSDISQEQQQQQQSTKSASSPITCLARLNRSSSASSSGSSSASSSSSLLASQATPISRLLIADRSTTSGSCHCSSLSNSSCTSQSSLPSLSTSYTSSCCSSSQSDPLSLADEAHHLYGQQERTTEEYSCLKTIETSGNIASARNCPFCRPDKRTLRPKHRRRQVTCNRVRRARCNKQKLLALRVEWLANKRAASKQPRLPLIRARASSLHHWRPSKLSSDRKCNSSRLHWRWDSHVAGAGRRGSHRDYVKFVPETDATSVRQTPDSKQELAKQRQTSEHPNHLATSMNELTSFLRCPNCRTSFRSSEMLLNSDSANDASDNITSKPSSSSCREIATDCLGGGGANTPYSGARANQASSNLLTGSPSIAVQTIYSVDLSQSDCEETGRRQITTVTNGRPPIMVEQAVSTDSAKSSSGNLARGSQTNERQAEANQQKRDSALNTMNFLSPMDLVWRSTTDSRALSCTETSLSNSLVAQLTSARSKSLCADPSQMKSPVDGQTAPSSSFKITKRFGGLGRRVSRLTRNALDQIKRMSASNPNIVDPAGNSQLQSGDQTCNYNYKDQRRAGSEKYPRRSSSKTCDSTATGSQRGSRDGQQIMEGVYTHKLNRYRSVSTAALVYEIRGDQFDNDKVEHLRADDDQQLHYSPDGVYIGPGGICSWRDVQRAEPRPPASDKRQPTGKRRSAGLPGAGSGAASWLARPLRSSVAQALLGRNSFTGGEWQPVGTAIVVRESGLDNCEPASGCSSERTRETARDKANEEKASGGRLAEGRRNEGDINLENRCQRLQTSNSTGEHQSKTRLTLSSASLPASESEFTGEPSQLTRPACHQWDRARAADWTATNEPYSARSNEEPGHLYRQETCSSSGSELQSARGAQVGLVTSERVDLHQVVAVPLGGAFNQAAGPKQQQHQHSVALSDQRQLQASQSGGGGKMQTPTNRPGKTWISNITQRVSHHHQQQSGTKSASQSQTRTRSPARKVVTCDNSKPGACNSPAYLAKESRSNSLSGLHQRVKMLDLSKSSMELHVCDETGGPASSAESRISNGSKQRPICLYSEELSSRNSASSQDLTPTSKSRDFDLWFRRSFKLNNSNNNNNKTYHSVVADFFEQQQIQMMSQVERIGAGGTPFGADRSRELELYGANLRSICVHCQLIAELSTNTESCYLNQLLPYVSLQQQSQQLLAADRRKLSAEREEISSRSFAEAPGQVGHVSVRPSVVLTVCSNQATLDSENEDHSTANSNQNGEDLSLAPETRTLVHPNGGKRSQLDNKCKSVSSAFLFSHSSSEDDGDDDDDGDGRARSSTSASSAEQVAASTSADSEGIESGETEGSLETSSASDSSSTNGVPSIESAARSPDDGSDNNRSEDTENDDLDEAENDGRKLSRLSSEIIQYSALACDDGDAAQANTSGEQRRRDHKLSRASGGADQVVTAKKVKKGSVVSADSTSVGPISEPRSKSPISKAERKSTSSATKKSRRKAKKKTKKKKRRSEKKKQVTPVTQTSSALLEVPATSKQARSASLDAPYLLKVPSDGRELATDDLFPNKSNRSRSVDISLPTKPGELYTVRRLPSQPGDLVNDGQTSADQFLKAGGSAAGIGSAALKKFIQGEIKVPCANGETRALKLFADWSEDCVNGEHLWIYVGSSSEACYVGENECLKHGPRLCCSACKITAHTSCISILIDKIKFICKHTFKDLTISNSRQVKELQQQNVIYHHWVHKRTHCGRCKQCTKTFGNTKLPFSSKEIQAITCSWCKVSYHNKENCYTLSSLTEPCTLGAHRESIIPPSWILKLPIDNANNNNKHLRTNVGDDENSIGCLKWPKDFNDFMQTDNLIDLSITSKNGTTNQDDANKLSYDHSNKENGEVCCRKQQERANMVNINNNQYGQQVFGSDTTLMTDTSGYMSADTSNLQSLLANKAGDPLSTNEQSKQSENLVQNMAVSEPSEEIIMNPLALQTADLSIINHVVTQQNQTKQHQHPQENMSMTRYQKHQLKQYYRQMDANNYSDQAMKATTDCDPEGVYATELQLQHQNQALIKQNNEGLYQNFKIVPQPVPGVPNAGLKPVLVFVNPRSGGNQGAKMMQKFNWLLNPRQVFDLIQSGGPRAALELYRDLPNLRILTIGGDGTASWILSHLDEVGIPNRIPVAVLPLGTGNDLARALGWGGGYADEPIAKILTQVRDGEIVQLDRWNLHVERNLEVTPGSPNEFSSSSGPSYANSEMNPPSITSSPSHFSSLSQANINTASTISILDQTNCDTSMIQLPTNAPISGFNATIDEAESDRLPMDVINNYFSFGVDAHIALEFHTAREAHPERFNSRLRNKMFYGQAGGKDLLKRKWKDLSNFVTLYCDGQDMTSRLKDLKVHSVLFLNIPSYGGGTRPWPTTATSFAKPRTDDGLIEVIGLTTYQLPLLQAGGHGTCIAQCRCAKIITSRTIPMQVDGEPCKLLPSIINISFKNRVCMLAKSKNSNKN